MKHKIHIHSTVFIWKSDYNVLFYNTESKSHLLLPMTNEISMICKILQDPAALYSFEYDDTHNPELHNVIEKLESNGFCIQDKMNESFISLPPILGINNNWEILKDSGKIRNVIELLRSITFVIGGSDLYINSNNMNLICGTKFNIKPDEFLDLKTLDNFISNNDLSYIRHLDFLVGMDCSSDYFNELLRILYKHGIEEKAKFYVIVNSHNPVSREYIKFKSISMSAIFIHHPLKLPVNLQKSVFIVQSKHELDIVTRHIQENKVQNYSIYPHYNGKNLKFYENNVLSKLSDIIKEPIPKRLVYIHQTLNINYFGHLLVLPNLEVYSNPLKAPVGDLLDSLYSLIYNEMNINHLWRRTRSSLHPCGKCLYRDLCPAPLLEEELIQRKCPDYIE